MVVLPKVGDQCAAGEGQSYLSHAPSATRCPYQHAISINARQQLSLCEVSSPSRFGCEELRPQLRMIMVDGWRRELRACSPIERRLGATVCVHNFPAGTYKINAHVSCDKTQHILNTSATGMLVLGSHDTEKRDASQFTLVHAPRSLHRGLRATQRRAHLLVRVLRG